MSFTALVVAYFYVVDRVYFSSKHLSPMFRYLLLVEDFKFAWFSLGICVVAAAGRWPQAWPTAADWAAKRPLQIAIAATTLLAVAARVIYHDTAFAMDEYAAVFQAKTFITGHLSARLPPSVIDWLIPSGFNGEFLIASRVSGATVEAYWPGFSLLLAPFEALNAGWLCNPCLAGLGLYLIYRITLDITGSQRSAGWALIFTLASGAFIANAISYYAMQAHLTLNLLFTWLLLRADKRSCVLAGVVGSVALVLHQPFPHAMFAAPWLLALVLDRQRRALVLPTVLGYLPLLLVIGLGWLRLKGSVMAGDAGFNDFSSNLLSVFRIPDKSMIDMRVAAVAKMWIWAVPGLFLLAALGYWAHRDDSRVRLLAASAALTFFGYFFVIFDQGHGWGFRYFHSAWGVIPILAALALPGDSIPAGRTTAFIGAVTLLSLLVVVPYQLIRIENIISSHNAELPPSTSGGLNVYFVHWPGAFYVADLVQIDPLLRGNNLVLFSRGDDLDAELRRQNWPKATVVARSASVEEWQLGPNEHWIANPASHGADRYSLHYTPPEAQTPPP